MASRSYMPAPVCLIENKQRRLVVSQSALQVLSKIQQPVVVVAIVGLYRTGKSYLMNKLAGKNSGFPLGSTIQANTKGIWMWCVPFPGKPDQTLVLLDTEGLGDVEKGDTQNDSWIFALSVLLSSTLVYNSIGTIDQQAMNRLHYVAELTECIKSKSSTGDGSRELKDSAEFVRFFPTFVWALRDFTLQLELNGHPITEDEYLENALKLKKGDSHDVQLFNLPRECIRMFFPTRKCFVFDRPTNRKNLSRLEEMQESDLDCDFVEQAQQFCHYIYRASKKKTIPGGHVVTGRLLANLVVTYVDTICSGQVPCMENAVLALAEIENSAAVREATACYAEKMEQKVKLPTETLQELLETHAECEEAALQVFMARAFKDDSRQFQVELMKILAEQKEEYCRKNEQESTKRCLDLLARLSWELEDKVKKGTYSQRGGYQNFLNDQKKLTERYNQESGKGIMAKTVLQQFLKEKEVISKAILQSDEALAEKDKQMEEEKAKAEAAERVQELQKQQLAEVEQKVEDQKRSYEMNIKQLEAKMLQEREKILEEQNKVLDCKLKEQEHMLKEGFQKHASQLDDEIHQLRKQNEDIKKPSWLSSVVGTLVDVASVVLPGYIGKGVAVISNLLRRL